MNVSASRKYNSHLLCASSLIYCLAGLLFLEKNPYLSLLLFTVTGFSIMYHANFKNFSLKALDLTFAIILFFYVFNLFSASFNIYIFSFILVLLLFRLVDYILFKTKRFGIFNYTHSLWHVLSGLTVLFFFVLK